MKISTFGTNKKYNIYILGKSFTQGLQSGATINAEHDYVKVNGSHANKKLIYLLIIMEIILFTFQWCKTISV